MVIGNEWADQVNSIRNAQDEIKQGRTCPIGHGQNLSLFSFNVFTNWQR
jgi:hypothetical protein